jgi:WD40 repeat protein
MVIAFSVAAILEGLRAGRKAVEASDAPRRAEEQLWAAQVARARASRLSGVAGRKKESLDALAAAAQLGPVPELRDELIAALALTDVSKDPAAVGRPLLPTDAPAFAPSLAWFALGRTNGEVEVFATGRAAPLTSRSGPQSRAVEVEFSPDERLLAARFQDGGIWVWSLTNGSRRFAFVTEVNRGGMSLDFSPDGRWLAFVGSTNRIRLFDCVAGAEMSPLEAGLGPGLAKLRFRPDGQVLAVNVSSNLFLWRTRDRRLERVLPQPDAVFTFTWHPDGRRLAATYPGGTDIVLWDTVTTRRLTLRGHAESGGHLGCRRRHGRTPGVPATGGLSLRLFHLRWHGAGVGRDEGREHVDIGADPARA